MYPKCTPLSLTPPLPEDPWMWLVLCLQGVTRHTRVKGDTSREGYNGRAGSKQTDATRGTSPLSPPQPCTPLTPLIPLNSLPLMMWYLYRETCKNTRRDWENDIHNLYHLNRYVLTGFSHLFFISEFFFFFLLVRLQYTLDLPTVPFSRYISFITQL